MKALLENLRGLSEARVIDKIKREVGSEEDGEFILELGEKASKLYRTPAVVSSERNGAYSSLEAALELDRDGLELSFMLYPRRRELHVALLGGALERALPGSRLAQLAGGDLETTIKYRALDDRLMMKAIKQASRFERLYRRHEGEAPEDRSYMYEPEDEDPSDEFGPDFDWGKAHSMGY